jgi:hypothetical protein
MDGFGYFMDHTADIFSAKHWHTFNVIMMNESYGRAG